MGGLTGVTPAENSHSAFDDEAGIDQAIAAAELIVGTTSPNPWVGAVVQTVDGRCFVGVTQPNRGPHAEVMAFAAAKADGADTSGGTLFVTLEPCAHRGNNPPCVEAVLAAKVRRVVVGVEDPDHRVQGRGVAALRAAGVEVAVGVRRVFVERQLQPFLVNRRTGRPYVVVKLAITLDGRTAAPDGSSRWITGPAAREDVHRLRSVSDVVIVGAGTVRADDPELTVRLPGDGPAVGMGQPRRIVIGAVPDGARVQPAESWTGDLAELLDRLGAEGVLQVLVEGGATLAGTLHRAGLVDRWVIYVAPAILGGDDGRPVLAGPGAPSMAEVWRGQTVAVRQLGDDVRIDVEPKPSSPSLEATV